MKWTQTYMPLKYSRHILVAEVDSLNKKAGNFLHLQILMAFCMAKLQNYENLVEY